MTTHHETTREIYHAQHVRLAADETARSRIHAMYTQEYFGINFKGLSVLDVGCGDMASLLIRTAQLGAAQLFGIEIGYEWIPSAKAELAREGLTADHLGPGNVLSLTWPDRQFDFVSCNGVLLHLANKAEVEQGFAECARVSKRYLYTTYGTGVGGLFEQAVFPAIRAYYRDNAAFRKMVDDLRPAVFREVFPALPAEWFDEDFCVFLQNALQPPSRMVELCTAEYIEGLYRKHGFKTRRLSRYVRRSNVRKFFSQLHFDKSNPVSKVLYGDGSVEFIGERA